MECDSDKLKSEGLSCADEVDDHAQLLSIRPIVLKNNTLSEFCAGLATLHGLRVDVLVLVAHSNADGVRLAADKTGFVSWELLPEYIRGLNPKVLLLVCCQAGRTTTVRRLFDKIPSLNHIIASPVNVKRSQVWALSVQASLAATDQKSLDLTISAFVRGLNLVICRGLNFHFTREQHNTADPQKDGLMSIVEEQLHDILPEFWQMLDSE
jgi:hypothetical protein